MNQGETREHDSPSLNGTSRSNGARPIITELARHIALALSQYVRQLHRKGLHAPVDVEELAALLAALSGERPGAPRSAADRRLPPSLAGRSGMTQHTHVPDRLLVTKREAAARLSVSVRTLERLAATGSLPQVQIGRLPRFRVSDLEAYVKSLSQDRESHPTSGNRHDYSE
jgi:excisionase family DNA binding protein